MYYSCVKTAFLQSLRYPEVVEKLQLLLRTAVVAVYGIGVLVVGRKVGRWVGNKLQCL